MSRLTVELPTDSLLGSPVAPSFEVHNERLELVARTRAGEPVELRAGRYVVSGRLPDGERVTQSVELGAEDAHVAVRAASGLGVSGGRRVLASAPPVSARRGLRRSRSRLLVWDRRTRLYARTLDDRGRRWDAGDIRATPASGPARGHHVVVTAGLEHRPGVRFLQVGARGLVPAVVVLPLTPAWQSGRCVVDVMENGEGIRAGAVMPAGNGRLIASYLTHGAVHEAADLAGAAELLLFAKIEDPLAAAIGGYALLRIGQLDRLHNWPANLAEWFPDMADGAVIAGVQALRAGDDAQAAQLLALAVRRGTPIFSVGFSLLVAALREQRLSATSGNLSDAVARLLALAPHVDYGQLTTSFHAVDVVDPAASRHPLVEFPREHGWQCLDDDDPGTEPIASGPQLSR